MAMAFRLESFGEPAALAQAPAARFSAAELEAELAKARGAARAQGFEEGVAAATAAQDAERKLLLERIAEALADASFIAEDARRAAEDALAPAVEALAAALAPELARAGLGAEIAARVRAALAAEGPPNVIVLVAPDTADLAEAALREAGLEAEIRPDPSLDALSARIAWAGGHDEVDLAARIAAVAEAAAAYAAPDDRRQSYG